jgi:hypothetical protein
VTSRGSSTWAVILLYHKSQNALQFRFFNYILCISHTDQTSSLEMSGQLNPISRSIAKCDVTPLSSNLLQWACAIHYWMAGTQTHSHYISSRTSTGPNPFSRHCDIDRNSDICGSDRSIELRFLPGLTRRRQPDFKYCLCYWQVNPSMPRLNE